MRTRVTTAFYSHRSLLAILLAFLILATFYNLSLPVYEAPDEYAHFIYVNWLAEGRGLPNLERDRRNAGHEIGQPPLYYALLAPFVAVIETSDMTTVAPKNPYFRKGGGINVHYHTPAERFPYRDSALAVHLARFVSTPSLFSSLVRLATTPWLPR
jgi:hypothetical protein